MQPSDVKIEHKEHGRVYETGNAEKVMCLHFVGLQADGAGLGDGSLGFLAPRFTLGCHQAKVCEIPSPILCKAIPLQHMKCTSVPESCPEVTVWQQSWPLLLQMQVCLPAAKAEGLHPGWHQHRLQKCPQHCPLRGSSHCTYSLQSWVTGYKDSVQFDVTHLTRHSKQE